MSKLFTATKLVVNYYDEGLRMPGPNSHIRTIIDRKACKVSIKHLRATGKLFYETKIPVSKEKIEEFFKALEQYKWEEDYSIPVCDGFSWDTTIKNNGKVIIKSKGTIEAPEWTLDLEQRIHSMIEDADASDFPILWGNLFEDEDEE